MKKISISLNPEDIDKANKIAREWDCANLSHCFRQMISKVELDDTEIGG